MWRNPKLNRPAVPETVAKLWLDNHCSARGLANGQSSQCGLCYDQCQPTNHSEYAWNDTKYTARQHCELHFCILGGGNSQYYGQNFSFCFISKQGWHKGMMQVDDMSACIFFICILVLRFTRHLSHTLKCLKVDIVQSNCEQDFIRSISYRATCNHTVQEPFMTSLPSVLPFFFFPFLLFALSSDNILKDDESVFSLSFPPVLCLFISTFTV